MIQINFKAIDWLPDEEVKIQAANKQMQALVSKLAEAPKYHTLTAKDRQQLVKEGYAHDLTDNLVFITQRVDEQTNQSDAIVVGFNYAAFDPSLFAGENITQHLKTINKGCCAYCESYLSATDAGQVAHYRPVELLEERSVGKNSTQSQQNRIATCSPYFDLAYEQSNLLYVCHACNTGYKGGLFPVQGSRYPQAAIADEQPLLVHPYRDNPREFIRFDPVSAKAYPFDKLAAFLQTTKTMTYSQAEHYIWAHPELLKNTPDFSQIAGFEPWFNSLAHEAQQKLQKGHATITTLGLNRPELVLLRLTGLTQLRMACKDIMSTLPEAFTEHELPVPSIAFRSLMVDAIQTWRKQLTDQVSSTLATKQSAPKTREEEQEPDVSVTSISPTTLAANIPYWLRASLRYCVEESQVANTEKRNLVLLSGKDKLYGQHNKQKCVFLPINWLRDQHRCIKVQSPRNIWETSFSELAHSRPLELCHLFAQNHVWVEGPFTALKAS
ncbi:hypothetical protein EYS14_19470 [Alteromonadaceae bacterium M269]|nr:hypothetical protein EYS14_19470 [Alteromonadaceae bacterium M269]